MSSWSKIKLTWNTVWTKMVWIHFKNCIPWGFCSHLSQLGRAWRHRDRNSCLQNNWSYSLHMLKARVNLRSRLLYAVAIWDSCSLTSYFKQWRQLNRLSAVLHERPEDCTHAIGLLIFIFIECWPVSWFFGTCLTKTLSVPLLQCFYLLRFLFHERNVV